MEKRKKKELKENSKKLQQIEELDLLQQATNPNPSETEVNGNDNLQIQVDDDNNIDKEKDSVLKDRRSNYEDNYATLELKPPNNNCDEWDKEEVSENGCDRIERSGACYTYK